MIFTIGHSTHPLEIFTEMLNAHKVQRLIDVRRYPASRRYPHFNRESLAVELAKFAIDYEWLAELGGRRAARTDSRNTRWRDASFRGYADYMETAAFGDAFARMERMAVARTSAIMCAEASWWRCHRSLLADRLAAGGAVVGHIADARRVEPHRYTEAAHIVEGRLSYAEDRLI